MGARGAAGVEAAGGVADGLTGDGTEASAGSTGLASLRESPYPGARLVGGRLVGDDFPGGGFGVGEELHRQSANARSVDRPARAAHVRVERVAQLGGGLPAIRWRDGERAHEGVGQQARVTLHERRRIGHLRIAHAADRLHVAVGVEEAPVERRLPERHAEREDVGAPIGRATVGLLRRKVRQRPLDHADGGRRDAVARLREAEVDELGDAVLRDEDVRGVHVAVHDVHRATLVVLELVHIVERIGNPRADPGDDLVRQSLAVRVCGLAHFEERASAQELHDEEALLVVLAQAARRHDVRVREARGDGRLVR